MIALKIPDMDAETIRRINANYWSHKIGRPTLAAKLGYQDTNYLNQLCAGHGDFGKRTARKFEQKLDLDRGWMDQVHPDLYPEDMALPPSLARMAMAFSVFKELTDLPSAEQDEVRAFIAFLKTRRPNR